MIDLYFAPTGNGLRATVALEETGLPYRLVAGPLASKADADKVCADIGLTRNDCFATTVLGKPL